jgi:hypothetical protein
MSVKDDQQVINTTCVPKKWSVNSNECSYEIKVNKFSIDVSIIKLDQQYAVPLNLGWQTFSPMFDPGDYKASDMLKDISSQGGYVTAISTYQEGGWQTYKVRGDQNYGTDFKIEQGKLSY